MIETLNVTRVHELAARMRGGVQQVIVGKDDVIDLALIALLCRGHVLVEDVPGIGKTTLSPSLIASPLAPPTWNRIPYPGLAMGAVCYHL